MKKILLYHASYVVIEKPDIHFGRKNADFGQGFYLTKDLSFARRWAKELLRKEEEAFQEEIARILEEDES